MSFHDDASSTSDLEEWAALRLGARGKKRRLSTSEDEPEDDDEDVGSIAGLGDDGDADIVWDWQQAKRRGQDGAVMQYISSEHSAASEYEVRRLEKR